MKKEIINSFADKYSLNGCIESVKWLVDSKNNQIKTSSISEDKNVLSFVTIKDSFKLEDSEIGVNDTTKLTKLLGVLDEEVELTFNKKDEKVTSILFKSGETEVQYVTADLSVIPTVPALKKLPVFNLEIPLTPEFISTFVKGKDALKDVDTFTLLKDKKDQIKLVIGYSNVNSNRVNINVKPSDTANILGKTLHFSAKYLKEILTSNDDCANAVLKISDAGLANVKFTNDNFECDYYLVEVKSI